MKNSTSNKIDTPKELIIDLSSCSLIDFYGAHDRNIKTLKNHFPKLKITAREAELKALGDSKALQEFEEKISLCIQYLSQHNKLNGRSIEEIITSEHSFEKHEKILFYGTNGKKVSSKTKSQFLLIQEVQSSDMVFAVGLAGTGKTYIAVALALLALKEKRVKRIVLTRPAVEAGENLGFLPGDVKEKLDPYLQPLYDALREMIPSEKLNEFLEKKIIQIAPLAFMRGRTLGNSFVILDEAQNTTSAQMKMFLTRMGKNSKFIITGDPQQLDLPRREASGFNEAIEKLKQIKGIGFVFFDYSDIIRHSLVGEIIKAYDFKEKSTI